MIKKFRNSTFAKETAVLSLGTIISQLITIFAMPLLTRIFLPEQFGILAIFLAISTIISTLVTLKFDSSIIPTKNDYEAKTILIVCLFLVISIGSGFILLSLLITDNIKNLMGILKIGNLLQLAIAAGMASAIVTIGLAWLNRQRKYVIMAILRITQSTTLVLVSLIFGYYSFTSGLAIGQFISSLVICIIIIKILSKEIIPLTTKSIFNIFKKHKDTPLYLLPAGLLDVITLQLPIIIIAASFSNDAAGQFSMAWRVLALPMILVGSALGQVFFQHFSESWPDANASRRLLIKTWKSLALIGVAPTVILLFFGEPIFRLVLGEAWGEAGAIASIIAPMLLAILISSPTSTTFLVLGLQRYSFLFSLSFVFYRSICILLGSYYNDMRFGLLLWVIIEIFVIFLYNYIALRRIK